MKQITAFPNLDACPSADQLRAFSAAALQRESMDAIERHVGQCDDCLCALEAWDDESDALIQALAALPCGPEDEPAFQTLQTTLLACGEGIDLGDSATASFAQVMTANTDEVPDQIGGYQLLELIGQGATGAVFRARHLKLDRIVAIKVLNARYVGHDSQAVQRFRAEMRAVGQLDHEHIVRATDAGEADGRHFLVMDYVDGIDASRLLQMTGPLRVADACEIVRQAATALQFAHEHNMVHRDVKPSNLLFSYDGRVKLLDLGLVRNDNLVGEANDAWQASLPHGTADYMPPEQWTHFAAVDLRADLYALGCSLYKLLAGRPVYPRPRHDYGAKMDAHLSAPIPSIRHERPDVPLGLQKIIGRMLAKRPADRYDSAGEVAERLQPYAQGHRLRELGARIASTPHDDFKRLPSEDTGSTHDPPAKKRRWTRRRLLIATAASVSLATLLWQFRSRRVPRLQLADWRDLQPTEPAQAFRRSDTPGGSTPQAEMQLVSGPPLRIRAIDDTLFHLGQPIQGHFAVHMEFAIEGTIDRLGLFFAYRPRMSDAVMTHPFQVIELAPGEAGGYRLLWSRYRFLEEQDGTFQCDYQPWAETPVSFIPATDRGQLDIALGGSGFPDVRWNGASLSAAHWTLSWQARHMSQQTRDELKHAYLGKLGIFARSSSAVFSRVQLRYLDEPEIL